MAQQIVNNGETGLVVRTKNNSNFTELYGLGSTPQYFIFEDGGTQGRIGIRAGAVVRDITDTPTGFAGAEDVDWHNIDSQS